MALWDKLRVELDRAGRAAQSAIDEGRVRLEIMRARRRADHAAQELGYAVYRARKEGRELEPDVYARLSSALAGHEADVARHEAEVARLGATSRPPASEPPLTGPVEDPPPRAGQPESSRTEP